MSTQLYDGRQHDGFGVAEGVVFSTKDYGLFRISAQNRKMDPEHVDSIVKSIKTKNLLHLFPIIVDRNGTVLDGQHRLEAAKQLEATVYYIVSGQMNILDVPMTTATVKKWSSEDYLNYYCERGVTDYLTIRALHQQYNFLRLHQIIDLAHIGDAKEVGKDWRAGTYKANAVPFCIRVAEASLGFRKYEHVTFYNHSYFVNALSNLMGNQDYDHERLMQKMEYLSRRLVKCPDTDSYIACINEIYNHRVLSENRVTLKKLNSRDKKFGRDLRNH